jgi:hypothetical protein
MPLLLVPLLLVLALGAALAMIPLGLVQRYRVSTRRRAARRWLATLNAAGFLLSSTIFLLGAAVTTVWIPGALTSSLLGFGGGVLLGFVGLALTRWEVTPAGVHFTPNRPLVLGLTLVVAARIGYGLWRTREAWQLHGENGTWLVTAGVGGSLAAGGVVLGYFLTYWTGVRSRAARPGW